MAAVYPTAAQTAQMTAALEQLAALTENLQAQGNAPTAVSTINASYGNLSALYTQWVETGIN